MMIYPAYSLFNVLVKKKKINYVTLYSTYESIMLPHLELYFSVM